MAIALIGGHPIGAIAGTTRNAQAIVATLNMAGESAGTK